MVFKVLIASVAFAFAAGGTETAHLSMRTPNTMQWVDERAATNLNPNQNPRRSRRQNRTGALPQHETFVAT